jgi:hypothetical protein
VSIYIYKNIHVYNITNENKFTIYNEMNANYSVIQFWGGGDLNSGPQGALPLEPLHQSIFMKGLKELFAQGGFES